MIYLGFTCQPTIFTFTKYSLLFLLIFFFVFFYQTNGTYTLAIGLSLSTEEVAANGTLFFNSVALQIAADNSTLYLSNVDEVREDLNCNGTAATGLSTVISGARIYGLDVNVFTVSTFAEIDLCGTDTDELEISYFI